MRQLKLSKRAVGDEATSPQADSLQASPVSEAEHMTRYITSVARQYQNQGLSQVHLIEVGEAAWQWVKLHYAQDTSSLDRWGVGGFGSVCYKH